MNDQPPLYIKIVVRSAGAVSAASIIAMLAGVQFADGSLFLCLAGIVIWASSEWDWWNRKRK